MSVVNERIKTELWCAIGVMVVMAVAEVAGLNGDHVCVVQQKYNITKRVKYRAPMSVRTYEWCLSMPPRCSKWSTEMRDLTRLETEERTAEVAVCCPGYKMKDVSCVPICPAGKTGTGCAEDCQKNKWGPNCVYECKGCSEYGYCSPVSGECQCREGRQGERCEISMPTPSIVEELTITKPVNMPTSSTDNNSTAKTPTTSSTRGTSTTITTAIPYLNNSFTTSTTTVPILKVTTSTEKAIIITTTSIPTILTKSAPKSSTMSTTVSTTLMTAIPNSKVEITLQTANVATFDAKKINTTPYITNVTSKNWNNWTLTTPWTLSTYKSVATTEAPIITSTATAKRMIPVTTEAVRSIKTPSTTVTVLKTVPTTKQSSTTTKRVEEIETFKADKHNLITDPTFKEATKKPEETVKIYPTTVKFKPKEIWIRPAQKGELLVETKVKPNFEQPHYKTATKSELTTNTTPRTIIVSIIPTSISYASFKKLALTTSSYYSHKNVTGKSSTEAFTNSMSLSTPSPVNKSSIKATEKLVHKATTFKSPTPFVTETIPSNATNSMSTSANKPNSSIVTTTPLTNSSQSTGIYKTPSTKPFAISTPKPTTIKPENVTEHLTKKQTDKSFATFIVSKADNVTDIPKTKAVISRTNDTKNITTPRPSTNVTEDPDGEETFHILTEPEHITAVMGEKGTERSSVDLISVMSIAGGVMMTVITVAVVIVMVERCKRPRYEEGKMNNIRMQVMIDNNDGPPPYVRSIFNTPLPEPPSTEKCHYQPISTLDRNLKQFMRPVVVQTISPMMLENFRGILECHYDHLPRRSVEFHTLQSRRSLAPSLGGFDEPRQQRPDSLAESAIEALKCEAKLDVIDNSTSEPLYAEIPCWRPPSAHAVEVVNLNGEAVTEL